MTRELLDLQAQVDFVAEGLGRKRAWAAAELRSGKIGFGSGITQANVCFEYTNNASRRLRRLPMFSWGPAMNPLVAPQVEMDIEGLLGEVADLFHRVAPSHWLFSRNLLELPHANQVDAAARSSGPNPVRAIRDYNIGVDAILVRFDVLYLRA